jgi:hypothetical protein
VLASRSTSGFSVAVEVALLYAWQQGMVVVCAGGDTNTPYFTATTPANSLASPNAVWYTNNTQGLPTKQPTSPSRFDVDLEGVGTNSTFWPNPTDPYGNTIPPPTAAHDRCYAILVGGNNLGQTFSATDENTWSTNSTSVGSDIDIVVPANAVPCATTTVGASNVNGLIATSGTSLSVGLVAGVAVAYLDHEAPTKTPRNFCDWLLPMTAAPSSTNPATPYQGTSSTLQGFNKAIDSTNISSHLYDNSYLFWNQTFFDFTGGFVPKLKINSTTGW